ncbi:nicotinic acetylcholine receptor subunit beta3-like protein, partial [Leptotrombidium deliense]
MNLENLFFLFLVSFTFVFAQDELPNINKLRKQLLANYDRHAFPVKDLTSLFVVNVTFYINKVTSLDTKTGIMTMDLYFPMKWRDEHLTWDPNSYGGLSTIAFGYNELWRPKIHIWNKVRANPSYQFIPRDYM